MTIDNELWYQPPPPIAPTQPAGNYAGKANTSISGGFGNGSATYSGKTFGGSTGGSGGGGQATYSGKPNTNVPGGFGNGGGSYVGGSAGVSAGSQYNPAPAGPWFGGTMLAAGFPVANALAGAGGGPWFDQPKGGRGGRPAQASGVAGASAGKETDLWARLKDLEDKFTMQGKVTTKDQDKWNATRPVNPQEPFVPQNVESSLRDSVALKTYQLGLSAQGDNSDPPRYFTPADALPVANHLAAQGVTVIDEETGQERLITELDLYDPNNPDSFQRTYYQPQSPWHLLPGTTPEPTKPTTNSGGYPKTWWGYGGGGRGGGYSSSGGTWQDYLMNLTTWRGL